MGNLSNVKKTDILPEFQTFLLDKKMVNLAALRFFFYKPQIGISVAIAFKNIHRTYTTLYDVMWISDSYYSRYARHGKRLEHYTAFFKRNTCYVPGIPTSLFYQFLLITFYLRQFEN
jgi:hypothetical protein